MANLIDAITSTGTTDSTVTPTHPQKENKDFYDEVVSIMAPSSGAISDSGTGVTITDGELTSLLDKTCFLRFGQRQFIKDLAYTLASKGGDYRLNTAEIDWLFYNHEKHATKTFQRFANTFTETACGEVFADMGYTAFSDTEAQKLFEEIKINREFFKGWGVPITLKMLTRLPLGRPPVDAGEEEPPVLMATEASSLKYTSDYRAMARLLDAYVAHGYEEEVIKFLTDLSDKEMVKKIKLRMQHDYVSEVSEANQTVTLTWLDETYVYEVSVKPPQAQLNQPPPPAPEKPNQEKLEQIARNFVEWYGDEDLAEVENPETTVNGITYILTSKTTSAGDMGGGGEQPLQPVPTPPEEPIAPTGPPAPSAEGVPLPTELTPPPPSQEPEPSPKIPTPDMTIEEIMKSAPTSTLERPLTSEFISDQGWKPEGVINGIEINKKGRSGGPIRGIKKGLTLSPVQILRAITDIREQKGPIRSIKEIEVLYEQKSNIVYGVMSDKTFSILEMAGTKFSADEIIIEFQSYEFSIDNVMSSFDVHIKQKKPKDKRQGKVEDNIARWFKDLVDWELLGDDSKYKRFKQFIEQTTPQYQEGRWIYKKQADGTYTLTLEWVAKPELTPNFVADYMNDIIQFAAKQEREREVE